MYLSFFIDPVLRDDEVVPGKGLSHGGEPQRLEKNFREYLAF